MGDNMQIIYLMKGLEPRNYKELFQFKNKDNPIKMDQVFELNFFPKEDVKMASKHVEICSTSLNVMEM